MIIPKHLFADYIGGKSRDAPTNLKPVGTGPTCSSISSRATWSAPKSIPTTTSPTGRISTRIEIKGGGDAVSAARAVLQTGEYDYAWNMQVEDEILRKLEGRQGQGLMPSAAMSNSSLNSTDPVDRGRRRARQHQDQASAVQRSGGAPGHQPV
jgi:peptide/nickel transport system substrate-binding protein